MQKTIENFDHFASTAASFERVDGLKEYRDDNGVLIMDETVHSDGSPASRAYLDEDNCYHGVRVEYDTKGRLKLKANHYHGPERGWTYKYKKGRLIEETRYWDGIKKERRKYKKGVLVSETFYKPEETEDGEWIAVRHGERKTYDRDGNLDTSTMYNYGRRWGLRKEYYKGHLFRVGRFEDGMPVGSHKQYDLLSGKLEKVTPYDKDSQLHGIVRRYDTTTLDKNGNSVLREEMPYCHGNREGVKRYYDNDGKCQYKEYFVMDVQMPQAIYWLWENRKDIRRLRIDRFIPALFTGNKESLTAQATTKNHLYHLAYTQK